MDWQKNVSFLAGEQPSWARKVLCVVAGLLLSVLLRTIANLIAPGMSPYTFLFPACLLATLFAGWQSGVLAVLIVGGLSQVLVVPEAMRNGLPMRYPLQAALVAAIGAAAIIGLAEWYRRGVAREARSGKAAAADTDLFYRELQHRVGNNLTIVTNLLDLQRQKANDPASRAVLEDAIGRVRSIAQIHRRLDLEPRTLLVEMGSYLGDLCDALRDATLPPSGIVLRCKVDKSFMRPDDALAVGLISNELVTNAVKHAFPRGHDGSIEISFCKASGGWQLTISDDGVGAKISNSSGLGTRLIKQLARQLGGQFRMQSETGTKAVLDLPLSSARADAD